MFQHIAEVVEMALRGGAFGEFAGLPAGDEIRESAVGARSGDA